MRLVIKGLAQNTVSAGRSQQPANLLNLLDRRIVKGVDALAILSTLLRAEEVMLPFKLGQTFLLLLDLCGKVAQLSFQPAGVEAGSFAAALQLRFLIPTQLEGAHP